MLPLPSSSMDERQCYSSTRVIGFSWATLNDNDIRAVSTAHQYWLPTTNRFSRHIHRFHQGFRSTVAWRLALQIAPNELSTRTGDLHYRIPEQPEVLHRNEPSHIGHLHYRKSYAFSSVRRWSCTDHPCLSMVASNWIRTSTGTNRPASIESSPSLRHRVETADQFSQDRMAMDTSTSVHSNTLSRSVNNPSRKQPCTNTLAITLMNVSDSMNIVRGCFKKSKRTLLSSNTTLDRKRHQRERESSSLKHSFKRICKWYTRSGQCCRSVPVEKSKRKIDNCLASLTIGGMQPMMKFDGYQTTRQQNQKHSASFVDSSIKLQRFHLSFSKITFWVKPCLCIYECTSMDTHSLMLYLEEDSTSISASGWTLLWTKNENATLIVYRTCWATNTNNELREERERDWKSGLIVDFPIIRISDQIKHSHTHTH